MFDVNTDYEPNTELGQTVQYCRCADAHIKVIPKFERDRTLIPFTAYVKRHIGAPVLENTSGEVTEWQTGKHTIGSYFFEITPKRGTSHHDYRDIPASARKYIPLEGNRTADIQVEVSRKQSIIHDIPYDFKVDESATADSGQPLVESGLLAALTNDFVSWPPLIVQSATRFAVLKSLVLSIAVMETTHGWYDEPLEWIGENKSIRPMNINVEYWPELFTEADMYDAAKNFDAGAYMLRKITERLAPGDRTVRKIATLYNNINASTVTDYGARVDYFTKTLRPEWLGAAP